jgi:APA family basic amino acid/polyamine antiporter
MARDGLLSRQVARLDPVRHHTRMRSLAVQCLWACADFARALTADLLDYVIFAVLLFYILTIAGVFVLRRKRPEMNRPYRAWGYPVLPAALHRRWPG